MKRIKLLIPVVFVLLTALWLAAEPFTRLTWSYFSIRGFAIQYFGILAISVMSIAMILALRLAPIERFTKGLDKSYRLHKWLGISALVTAIIHWFWAKGTKYLVGMGLLEKPVKHAKNAGIPLQNGSGLGEGLGQGLGQGAGQAASNAQSVSDPITIEGLFHSARHFAESVGEWGFYALVLLIAIALVKSIRYSRFLNTHKLMSVVYLVFAFHSIVLIDFDYWQTPIAWLVATLITGGSISAVYSLCGKIGQKKSVCGTIERFHFYKDNRVLDITINTNQQWAGHQPGQFAFVRFKGEEAHPFTIASVDEQTGSLRFQIKGIGDFTNTLNGGLKLNDQVEVEGPYGYFNFKSSTERQIWIAGGIGIAAFTAQMESLAINKGLKAIDLFYCTRCPDADFIQKINGLAANADINLHIIDTHKDGHLTAEYICDRVREWQKSDIWFCGPSNFSKTLKDRFAKLGLNSTHFHNELFDMR